MKNDLLYYVCSNEVRTEVKAANPEATFGQLATIIAAKWKVSHVSVCLFCNGSRSTCIFSSATNESVRPVVHHDELILEGRCDWRCCS